jgi:hypothetical protein
MSKYFSEEYGPTFYTVIGVSCAVIPLASFWVGYLCVRAAEYWPLIWVALVTSCLWLTSYYSFRTASRIKQAQNRPKDDL